MAGQCADAEGVQSARGMRQAAVISLAIVLMFTTSLFLAGPAVADGDNVDTPPGTNLPVDLDPTPVDPGPEAPSPEIPQPPVERPDTPEQPPALNLPAPANPAPKPVQPAPAPVQPAPKPVEAPASPVQPPSEEPAPAEVPVSEAVDGQEDTATPSAAAPSTTAPATTLPATTAPSTPGNLDSDNASMETSNRASPIWLQLAVVALLLAAGVAYTRFIRRGSRPLKSTTGPEKSK